uniref:Uncharacterized protein n=1 Tax=Saccharum hybrid cultivar R570 TaxID=131158 RepID=A0A059Q1I8_9POAL|nr:hypothetical protein SHCRBa_013_P09_F_220 [Saccharum hybrid cultivar R570]
MGSRVRVLNVTHVRPPETSNPLPDNDDHAIKISLFDTMFLPYQPMQRLFFYEGDDLPPFPALLCTLQSSLAATLAVFTPLVGNFAVSKSGDVYAGSSDDMRRLASDAEHDAEAYAKLVPTLVVSALPARALVVQVTRPADADDGGGFGAVVVGVSMCHGVGDGQALWEFIRAWAAAARGGSPALPGFLLPVFDRAVINSHPKAEAVSRTFLRIFAPALPMVSCSVNSARTYLLSASQIRSLKQRISPQSSGSLADGDSAPPAAVAKPPDDLRRRGVPGLDVRRPRQERAEPRRRRRLPPVRRGLPRPPAPAHARRVLRQLRQAVLREGYGGRAQGRRRGRAGARRVGGAGGGPGAAGGPAGRRRPVAGALPGGPAGQVRADRIVQPVRRVRYGLWLG